MLTYSQVEQALLKLGYAVDVNLPYHTKLTAIIPVDGYEPIILEFRESYQSVLGDSEELLQMEWFMNDNESCLVLDLDSLNSPDELPDVFPTEKKILREIFDRVLKAIAQQGEQESKQEYE